MTVAEMVIVSVSLIVAVSAVISGGYIAWVYRQRREEAPFLTRLVWRDLRVAAGSFIILVYIALSLTGHTPGRPWGSLVIGAVTCLFMYGVISDALLWRRERAMKAETRLTNIEAGLAREVERNDAFDVRQDAQDVRSDAQDKRVDAAEAKS